MPTRLLSRALPAEYGRKRATAVSAVRSCILTFTSFLTAKMAVALLFYNIRLSKLVPCPRPSTSVGMAPDGQFPQSGILAAWIEYK